MFEFFNRCLLKMIFFIKFKLVLNIREVMFIIFWGVVVWDCCDRFVSSMCIFFI